MVIVGGIIAPAGLVWWIYTSGDDALILISAQWINWSIYSLGFLCGALMSLIGGHLLRSHWMMIFALGCLYWAAGCMMGGLQAGNNPALAPIIALPYVRAMWLLGAAAWVIATIGLLERLIHIVPRQTGIGDDDGLDQDDADSTD